MDSSPICHFEWQRSWHEEPYDRVRNHAVNGYFAPLAACIVLSAAMELSAVRRSLTPASPPLRMTSRKEKFLLAGFVVSVKMGTTPLRPPEFFEMKASVSSHGPESHFQLRRRSCDC